MKYKLIGFYEEPLKKIEKFAKDNCEDNFSLAVRKLTESGLLQESSDKKNKQK